MLTGERIKPYLLHEDRWLRVAAVHYFYESWSRDADLVPMVLAGCERFGLVESVPLLSCCRRFPLTESAFQAALALLAETEDANTIMHLGGMIASAPVELLANNEMRVFDNKHLLAEYRPKIQHRLGVSRWSDDRLWHELQDFSLRSADAKFAGEIDHAYADALVEALA
ncbi:MAG: hypothetical protein HY269_06210, partial [Deltaproteobacteria bacterium]|nr:hypothetical protein [Deltaproteobacteria bacterium]